MEELMGNRYLDSDDVRLKLIQQYGKLSIVPELLERASQNDSSLTPTQLHGAATLTEEIVAQLRCLSESLEQTG
jgi:hypothetical protein